MGNSAVQKIGGFANLQLYPPLCRDAPEPPAAIARDPGTRAMATHHASTARSSAERRSALCRCCPAEDNTALREKTTKVSELKTSGRWMSWLEYFGLTFELPRQPLRGQSVHPSQPINDRREPLRRCAERSHCRSGPGSGLSSMMLWGLHHALLTVSSIICGTILFFITLQAVARAAEVSLTAISGLRGTPLPRSSSSPITLPLVGIRLRARGGHHHRR